MAPRSAFTARRAGYMFFFSAIRPAPLPTLFPYTTLFRSAIGGCNSDPVVTLSNGAVLDLHATVSDNYDDVQQESYNRHAPAGAWVTSEVDTSLLGGKDTFLFRADNPPNTYSATTKVTTLT